MDHADGPVRKQVRLSRACNQCRIRKLRCDEGQPACRRCVNSGVECITTNPRSSQTLSTSARRRAGSARDQLECRHSLPVPLVESSLARGSRSPNSFELKHPSPDVHAQSREAIDQLCLSTGTIRTSTNHADASLPTPSQMADGGPEGVPASSNGPPAESPSFAMNVASHVEQKYLGPSSLQLFTQWLSLTFQIPSHGLLDRFEHGMRHCEEMDMPEVLLLPALPSEYPSYLTSFFSSINSMYPIIDQGELSSRASTLSTMDPSSLSVRERPRLVTIYAVMALGAAQQTQLAARRHFETFLAAACSLYGYLVAYPYLESAQALLLISLALRCRSKDGAGSQAVGQAIRILQSIGLHRKMPTLSKNEPENISKSLGKVVWSSAYSLERITCLESGRPSILRDKDMDQASLKRDGTTFLDHILGLNMIQGRISDQLFDPSTVYKVSSNILMAQGQLDADLLSWQNGLPAPWRPDREYLPDGSADTISHAFLCIHFYSTMAIIHRPALLIDNQLHKANVHKASLSETMTERLLHSESICVNAARKIAQTFLELCRQDLAVCLTMTQPLMATYVLAIHTLKHPTMWSARSDLGLVQATADAVETRYRADGQHPEFYSMLSALQRFASHGSLIPAATIANTRTSRRSSPSAQDRIQDPVEQRDMQDSSLATNEAIDAYDQWDSLYPSLFTGQLPELSQVMSTEEMHELMGIPHFSDEELINFNLPFH